MNVPEVIAGDIIVPYIVPEPTFNILFCVIIVPEVIAGAIMLPYIIPAPALIILFFVVIEPVVIFKDASIKGDPLILITGDVDAGTLFKILNNGVFLESLL